MTTSLFDLSGKVAVVTGAGRGLGKAIAKGLAEAGAKVVLCGRTADIVETAAAELCRAGLPARAIKADARHRAEVQRVIDGALETFGRLDIMVINHGIGRAHKPEAIEPEQWEEMIEINLTSAFTCAQLAGRHLIAQGAGGSIVFVSSSGSFLAFEGLTAYGAAKGGMDQLCRQLAMEWGRHGIRVNAVNPGHMSHAMRSSEERHSDPADQAAVEVRTPLGRRGEAREIAGPVIFLASDAASFVTGHILTVDGGHSVETARYGGAERGACSHRMSMDTFENRSGTLYRPDDMTDRSERK